MTRRAVRQALVPLLLARALTSSGWAETPVSLALVIDRSGSLSSRDLERTRQLAHAVFSSLPAGSEAAVFVFDDESRLVCALSPSIDQVDASLEEVRTTGRFTALHDALYDASRYLRDSGHGRRAILLVTDGKDENSALVLEDGLRVAQDTRIPVFAVGVGRVEERVLRRIAKLTSGQYVTMAEAAGATLAASIAATAPSPSAASTPSAATLAPSSPVPSRGRPVPAGSVPGRLPRAVWAGLLLLVAAAAGIAALGLRRRVHARCARCGAELASAFSPCPSCREARVKPPEPGSDAVSQTVVARMNITEEYLEKTVTLRERPVLVVTQGAIAGQVVRLSPEVTTSIGRAKANDIVLDDVSVSSQHCRVRPENGRFVVHDLNSTNGTFVNERRVTRHPLAEGDVIKVGETSLQFRMERGHD